ncbi:MAG: zinc ribbon domain-containing protein [Butyrivibrio sp.]|nr:zinc ribbon domain-containing protein [Butyrivibrio sp.]
MGKFCSNCGAELKPGALFCHNCGTATKSEASLTGLVCAVFAAVLLTGCVGAGSPNMPYELDTPAPHDHEGRFVSEHGSMTFNGDGTSITIDFDEALADLTDLPSGEQEGEYVFLSGDLPPVGSMDVRYDVAHEMRISVGDVSSVIRVGVASDDGNTATVGTGMVTPERIPLLFDIDGKNVTYMFEKE